MNLLVLIATKCPKFVKSWNLTKNLEETWTSFLVETFSKRLHFSRIYYRCQSPFFPALFSANKFIGFFYSVECCWGATQRWMESGNRWTDTWWIMVEVFGTGDWVVVDRIANRLSLSSSNEEAKLMGKDWQPRWRNHLTSLGRFLCYPNLLDDGKFFINFFSSRSPNYLRKNFNFS